MSRPRAFPLRGYQEEYYYYFFSVWVGKPTGSVSHQVLKGVCVCDKRAQPDDHNF